MFKSVCIGTLLSCITFIRAFAQTSAQSQVSNYRYYPPSQDKPAWQWLNLMTSATFYRVVKEGEEDFNSCLLHASRSLGLSRITVLAEGIDNLQLNAKSSWIDRQDPAAGLQQLSQQSGKQRLHQLLLLGAYYAFQPRRSYHKDSAEYFLKAAIRECAAINEIMLRRQALCLLGKNYLEVNDSKQADSVFNKLIQECREAGDKQTEVRALFYRAMFPEFHPATTVERISNFQKAAELYRELNNKEGEINAITDAGYLLVTTFALREAQDAFSKALEKAEAIQYPYTHYLADALAMATTFQGKFGEPFKYNLQTIKTAEATKDSLGWGYFYSRLGSLYYVEGEREEESLKWSLKALDRFLKTNDAALYLNLYNTVSTLTTLGRCNEALELISTISKKIPPRHPQDKISYNLSYGIAYKCANQYKLAEMFALRADSILKASVTLRHAYQRSLINLLLGGIYLDQGMFENSRKFLDDYLSAPPAVRLLLNDIWTYRHLITIDSAMGNVASEIKNYKQYNKLLDSNFRASKIRQAEELQVLYLTEEKENKIALLNQQAKLEQAKLREATLFRNVTIAGILAVLIIAGLLFRQSMIRKKHNEETVRKNEQLQHFLTEKEWLLKEIHHRVKNNLQTVMSLLNSQSAYIDNAPALTAIHDSQHRVHAMSLIHQKLYNTENASVIEMSVYIRELASYLTDSFNAGQRIHIYYNIEPISMDVGQAVPLGLILNEAVTNALKYAFPNESKGEIKISLTSKVPANCMLIISDNGVGMTSNAIQRKGSLGMTLMQGLTEDLEGNLSIENNNGTTVTISFPLQQLAQQSDIVSARLISSN